MLVLVVDLGAENVEPRAGAGIVIGRGLVEGDLGGEELCVDGFDARGIGDAEQVSVADGENDEVAGVFGGELCAFEVVFRGEIVFQRGDVDEVLGEVGAEVDDLEGPDDGVETGNSEAEGCEVDLLNFKTGGGVDRGEKRLQLFKTLAVGVFDTGGLQDEAEILAKAALDGVVEREVHDVAGGFADDDAAVVGVLGGLRAVLAGGGIEILLCTCDRGAVGGGTGPTGLFLLRRTGSLSVRRQSCTQ